MFSATAGKPWEKCAKTAQLLSPHLNTWVVADVEHLIVTTPELPGLMHWEPPEGVGSLK